MYKSYLVDSKACQWYAQSKKQGSHQESNLGSPACMHAQYCLACQISNHCNTMHLIPCHAKSSILGAKESYKHRMKISQP